MIKTKNPGVQEAINEIEVMSLGKTLRWLHESRLKAIRDRNARDDYVRDEGIAMGKACVLIAQARRKLKKNVSAEEAAEMLEEDADVIRQIYGLIREHPQYDDYNIFRQLDKDEKQVSDNGELLPDDRL